MIRISRQRNDGNGNPIQPPDSWFTAATNATQTAISEGARHQASGSVYARDDCRAALEALFHWKCAYCERPLPEQWDVEHYRPKGRVAERAGHPGYYWLAYAWENLLPSCTHCNQRRKDKPIWGDLNMKASGGKLDQFPLEDESSRAMAHTDDVAQEKPLLLNPCEDDPEQFLGYDPAGQVFAVSSGDRGGATIDICHLKRRRLARPREKKIAAVCALLRLVRDAQQANVPAAVNQGLQDLLVTQFLDESCCFAGVARYVHRHPADFGV